MTARKVRLTHQLVQGSPVSHHVSRKRLSVLAVSVLAVVATGVAASPAVASASASKPVRIPAPIGISNTFAAGTACPFTLHTELVGGNQAFTFFADGRFHATGVHIDRYTNVDSGSSTTLALQGSVDVVPTADGGSILQGSGKTGFVFFPGDAGPGDTQTGRFYIFTGQFRGTSDPSGAITTFKSTGQSLDVCAMLM